MVEQMLSAWALAGLLSKVYALVASLVSWYALLAWSLGEPPLDLLTQTLEWAGVRDLEWISDASTWTAERGSAIGPVLIYLGLAGLLFSWLVLRASLPEYFDVVRGPATAWLCLAALLQVGGKPDASALLVRALLLLVIVLLVVYVVNIRHGHGLMDLADNPNAQASFGLVAGLFLVPFLAVVAGLNAIGGMTRPRGSPQESSRLERVRST